MRRALLLLLAAAAAAEKRSWFGSSHKKEKPVTKPEGRAVQLARKVLEARTVEDAHALARAAPTPPDAFCPTNTGKQTLLVTIFKSTRCERLPARRGVRVSETAHEDRFG